MAQAPYGLRLLVGAAITAMEETRRLPQTLIMYPMTVASTIAQFVMKFQQDLASLAIRGDAALESVFPPRDQNPEWATFDDPLPAESERPSANGQRQTEGRFALYSVTDTAGPRPSGRTTKPKPGTAKAAPPPPKPSTTPPPIAVELDYESLTLAQLRARIQSLSVEDLRALLAFEDAAKSRAPFQTLLANRITRATAK